MKKRMKLLYLRNILLGGAVGFVVGGLITGQQTALIVAIGEIILSIALNIVDFMRWM